MVQRSRVQVLEGYPFPRPLDIQPGISKSQKQTAIRRPRQTNTIHACHHHLIPCQLSALDSPQHTEKATHRFWCLPFMHKWHFSFSLAVWLVHQQRHMHLGGDFLSFFFFFLPPSSPSSRSLSPCFLLSVPFSFSFCLFLSPSLSLSWPRASGLRKSNIVGGGLSTVVDGGWCYVVGFGVVFWERVRCWGSLRVGLWWSKWPGFYSDSATLLSPAPLQSWCHRSLVTAFYRWLPGS
ncbi:hypothetical protein B0I37DRAFT_39042 [Chaetomium sp. MPI-CAGE-AT-0009]|nr:hypothetical protein B0I37DRAFT_39042 [Chaetomium sp. MPI-CAGE-AT-0009]